MSSNLEEEVTAADPAADPVGDSATESSKKVEMKDSGERIADQRTTVVVTETAEVSVVESETAKDVDGGMELKEKGGDPTEMSLDELTGGLDMEGQLAGEEIEEGEMEAFVEKEEAKGLSEMDPVEEVKESESTEKQRSFVEGVQEKESTGEESGQKNEEAGEVQHDKGQDLDSKPTGDVQKQELEGLVQEEEKTKGEELDKEAGPVEEKIEETAEIQPVLHTEKLLEETVETPAVASEKVPEEIVEAPAVVSEKGLEETVEMQAVVSENVLEEIIEAPAVITEKVLEETVEAPAVASEKLLEETVETPAVVSEKLLEETVDAPAVTSEPMEITSQVESATNVLMEVDLNCENNAESETQSENIWSAELAGEDSRNELTVNDFIMVEAKEVEETEQGPTFTEVQTNIQLGERTVEQNNTQTVSTNTETKEPVIYHRREKHAPKPSQAGPDSSVTQTQTQIEEQIPVKYNLPTLDKGDFVIYDLIWGKVKSHPWWPGLIISPSDASNLATKYKKGDSFLVAYFGDKTFAWCEKSQLKPFFENFSHYEKQASTDAFKNAIKSVLMEVSRRFEVGSICSCLDGKLFHKEVYPKMENAGVKQGFDNCEVSRGEIINYFNPEGIVGFVKNLALEPFKGTDDKLGLNMVTSLVKSLYRKKGYSFLPKFQTFGPLEDYVEPSKIDKLVENNTFTDEINTNQETTLAVIPNTDSIYSPVILSQKNINQIVGLTIDPPPKRKRGRPPKKKKEENDSLDPKTPLSDLINRKPVSNLSNGSKSKPEKSTMLTWDDESASPGSLPWTKQKPIVDFDFSDQESKSLTHSSGFGFKIGACISRAASRITGSGSGSQPVMTMPKFDNTDFDVSSDDELASPKESGYFSPEGKKVRKRRLKKYHYSDPHEIVSQLCFLATSPLKEYVFINTVVSYFTDFRKYIISETETEPPVPVSETVTVPEKVKRGRKRKVDIAQVQMDHGIDNSNQLQDSYWSDMILSGQTEEPNVWPKVYKRRASVNLTNLDPKRALLLLAASNRPVIRVEEKRLGECNPTALLLDFTNRYGPVPVETDLVRIFSRYGALKGVEMDREMEGKVWKVKVMFKRRVDADVAFGNLRTKNVFGPALMSYRLVYVSELERKSKVQNGDDHSNLDVVQGQENLGLTCGAQGDDVSERMDSDTGAISMGQASDMQTEVQEMITEMSSEILNEPSELVQSEEAQTAVTEISNEPSNLVQGENEGGENQMDHTRDEMEIYDPGDVQAGDDSLNTVQEEVVGLEGSVIPLESNAIRAQIENEKHVNQSESDMQAENATENEEPVNPSESDMQTENATENEEPVNPSESDMQTENATENEEPVNPSESDMQTENVTGNEEPINPASTEGEEDVAEMQIDQPNIEGQIVGDEGEIADVEGLNDAKPEQGGILGDEGEGGILGDEEELSGETEHGEISCGEELEQGEILSDRA